MFLGLPFAPTLATSPHRQPCAETSDEVMSAKGIESVPRELAAGCVTYQLSSDPHAMQTMTVQGTNGFLSTTLQTILMLCTILRTGISSVKVDVRCYCNLPMCFTSGYMCKSSTGICVSDKKAGDTWRWTHACLELVSFPSRQMAALDCEENVTRQCCTEDMCNYIGNMVLTSSHQRPNNSHITGYLSNYDTTLLRGGDTSVPRPWFRITIVAVPVVGGLVLVILIIMAARMLREDRQLPFRAKPANTKVVYQSEKSSFILPKSLSCMLLSQSREFAVRSYASAGSLGQPSSWYRSVSVSLSTDTDGTDSSKEKYFVFDI